MDRQKRGFRMSMSLELFSEIIGKAMGLDREVISITQVHTAGWNKAVEICAVSRDERFPELKDGERFPYIHPRLKREVIELEDGSKKIETHFDGFEVMT